MSTETILSQLKMLEESGNAILLEPIDILWGIPNQFINSIENILIILVKTSSIPLIPDYTKSEIYTNLGITSEQAKIVQESNQTLIQLQTYIEKYCVQQYTLFSIIKQTMDEIVLGLPETSGDSLLEFIESGIDQQAKLQGGENIQVGGNPHLDRLIPIILKIIFLFVIVLPSGFGDQTNKPQLVTQQTGMVSVSANQLIKGLFEQLETRSGPVDVNTLVVQFDKKNKEQTAGIIGSILSFIKPPENGQQVLQKAIESFNIDSRKFSRSAEESCIELMKMAKDKGVFKEWRDMDSLKETSDKLQNISTAVENQNANIQSNMFENTVGAVVSGAVMPITGDYNKRNFITKIITYDKICSVPNSMTVLPELLPILIDMADKKVTGTVNLTNPGLINHNEILEMYKEIVDPNFTWTNFSIEEQNKILDSGRSNNFLDTTKLQSMYNIKNIKDSVREMLYLMKEQSTDVHN